MQRSPSTMNVAVPSAQHSDRLGQPASSQTVTRPRSRTARFSASTSSPWCTLGRSQSGFRVEIANPPTTPASASRPLRWCVTSRTTGPRRPLPARRRTDHLAGGARPRPGAPPPRRPRPRRPAPQRRRPPLAWSTGTPSAASDVTDLPTMPQGMMWPNIARSVATLRAKPCMVLPRLNRTPMAAILRGFGAVRLHPHARMAPEPAGAGQPEVVERVDEHLLDRVHVRHGVGHTPNRHRAWAPG